MADDPGGGPSSTMFGSRFSILHDDEITYKQTEKRNKRFAKRETKREDPYIKIAKMENRIDNGPRYLVLTRKDPDCTMSDVSPFFIKKAFDAITPNVSISRLRDGKLLLKTVDRSQAAKLIKQTSLGGIMKIEIQEHETLNRTKGTISCYDLKSLKDEEILEGLKDEHVIEIKRIQRKNNKGKLEDTSVFILTFDLGCLPSSIHVGFHSCRVQQYIPNPMRCTKCMAFGHKKTECRGNHICGNCAELYHDVEQCERPAKCVNCRGSHSAFSRQCPVFLDELEIQKIKVTDRVSIREARQRRRLQAPSVYVPRFAGTYAQVTRNLTQQDAPHQMSTTEISTTQATSSTQAPSSMQAPPSTLAPSSKQAPSSTQAAFSTQAPSSMQAPPSTLASSSTQAPSSTQAAFSTQALSSTQETSSTSSIISRSQDSEVNYATTEKTTATERSATAASQSVSASLALTLISSNSAGEAENYTNDSKQDKYSERNNSKNENINNESTMDSTSDHDLDYTMPSSLSELGQMVRKSILINEDISDSDI